MKTTFITASYNYEKFITQTIESIQNQTVKDWELIIVDDGSSDNSVEVIKSYCNKDARIKLFQHENASNKGLIETLKLAISKAQTEWIAFLESDDFIESNYLEKKLEVLKKYPDVDFIFNEIALYGEADAVRQFDESFFAKYNKRKAKYLKKDSIVDLTPIITRLYKNPIPTFSCVMVKKSIMESLNYNSPSDRFVDRSLWAQIIAQGKKTYYISEQLTHWRITKTSYTNRKDKKKNAPENPSLIDYELSYFPVSKKLLYLFKKCLKSIFYIRLSKRHNAYAINFLGLNIANYDNSVPAFFKIIVGKKSK